MYPNMCEMRIISGKVLSLISIVALYGRATSFNIEAMAGSHSFHDGMLVHTD